MSELTLYLAPGTCAMAVRIALVEAGARTRSSASISPPGSNAPRLSCHQPQGRVPALVTERGVLTETPALLLYVAQRFPDAGLAPWMTPSCWPECRRCIASSLRRCTSPMPMAVAVAAGRMTNTPSLP